LKSEEFFREVDEELQRERLGALWKRYGTHVVLAAVALLLGVASWNGWHWWQERQRLAEARAWDEALAPVRQGRPAEAGPALMGFAEGASPGVAVLARLNAAAAEVAAGKRPEAAEALAAAAGTDGADPLLRDAATLLEIADTVDEAAPEELLRRIEPLTEEGASWRYTARELKAAVLVRAGRVDEARKLLDALASDPQAPASLQRRASTLASALEGAAGAS
jgi:hypothetical protein